MTVLTGGMIGFGVAALIAGLVLVRMRFAAASGVERILVLGPVFEAVSLAIFAAEHFFSARVLMNGVPRWMPWPLFWAYFVGVALLAAAISFIAWRCVRWSASLLAVLFVIIVVTMDLPSLSEHLHERIFWTLLFRETAFAGGAMVLVGSVWTRGRAAGRVLIAVGRSIVAGVCVFYALEHFLFPRFVPGVPLEKMIPGWWPGPVMLSCFVGMTLLAAGIGLMIPHARLRAAAGAGAVLVALTIVFYIPILITELGGPLTVEGINYVGDTLLFGATVLLAGFTAELVERLGG